MRPSRVCAGLTEFRRKWEDFFANDQQLRSEPSAEALLTDLAVREIAMADYKVRGIAAPHLPSHTIATDPGPHPLPMLTHP